MLFVGFRERLCRALPTQKLMASHKKGRWKIFQRPFYITLVTPCQIRL
jgi:hypothetical protein